MSDEPLVSMRGALHELVGPDVSELVLRPARSAEAAGSLVEVAERLEAEAARYERLHREGWGLDGPFARGRATARRDRAADAGPGAAVPATGGADHAEALREPVPAAPAEDLPGALDGVADGAPDLLTAAVRLRAVAGAARAAARAGRRLVDPVEDGELRLA